MMSWAPRCLATSVSRGAKGWEGVGPPVLHGEDWGAPSLARDPPPPPRYGGLMGVTNTAVWALRSWELSSLQSFTQRYTEEGRFWQHGHCPWLVLGEAGEHL